MFNSDNGAIFPNFQAIATY